MRKKKMFGLGLLALGVFGLIIGVAAAMPPWTTSWDRGQNTSTTSYLSTYTGELNQDEIDGLLWMREEEKLARDVYLTLYEKWGLPIFNNIAQSEQMHTDMVLSLIEKYNLTDPATEEVGVFTNPELQALYNQLVEMGNQSVEDALKVGALIEETDIKDLEEWLAKTDNPDIQQVYENLMKGSENHLRAFTSTLEGYGITYEPQVISEDYYHEVISSTNSHGYGKMGDATVQRGHGRMSGRGMMNSQSTAHADGSSLSEIGQMLYNTYRWMRGFAYRFAHAI